MENLDFRFNWGIMTVTHLAYPDLAIDKFSGTNPNQDADSLIQLIEQKINFALGCTWRSWWSGKQQFQEDSPFLFFTPKTSCCSLREQHFERYHMG